VRGRGGARQPTELLLSSVTIRIQGYELPGLRCAGLPGPAKPAYEAVHVGVQRRREVVDLVPGDAAEARWDLQVEVAPGRDGGLDFRGPWVHGKPGERFLYLSWGELGSEGQFSMFRRAKLWLGTIGTEQLQQAIETGAVVEGRLSLTGRRGGPLCASVRPPLITWSLAT
jgi:hypothetical protein